MPVRSGPRLPEIRRLEHDGVGRVRLPPVVHQQERVALREAIQRLRSESPVVDVELVVDVRQAEREVAPHPVGRVDAGLGPVVERIRQLYGRRKGAVGGHAVQPGRLGLGVVVLHAEVELAGDLRHLEVQVDGVAPSPRCRRSSCDARR